MSFYSLIEKTEFKSLIQEAKKTCMKEALAKLKEFEPLNETFMKVLLPDDTPEVLIKKRTLKPNKLLLKKREKELRRILG